MSLEPEEIATMFRELLHVAETHVEWMRDRDEVKIYFRQVLGGKWRETSWTAAEYLTMAKGQAANVLAVLEKARSSEYSGGIGEPWTAQRARVCALAELAQHLPPDVKPAFDARWRLECEERHWLPGLIEFQKSNLLELECHLRSAIIQSIKEADSRLLVKTLGELAGVKIQLGPPRTPPLEPVTDEGGLRTTDPNLWSFREREAEVAEALNARYRGVRTQEDFERLKGGRRIRTEAVVEETPHGRLIFEPAPRWQGNEGSARSGLLSACKSILARSEAIVDSAKIARTPSGRERAAWIFPWPEPPGWNA